MTQTRYTTSQNFKEHIKLPNTSHKSLQISPFSYRSIGEWVLGFACIMQIVCNMDSRLKRKINSLKKIIQHLY